jgi:hypothetical protein
MSLALDEGQGGLMVPSSEKPKARFEANKPQCPKCGGTGASSGSKLRTAARSPKLPRDERVRALLVSMALMWAKLADAAECL